ncbi:DUF6221 family protein [Actinokineospora globicatena]|uniref:Uncharacterized protein n=1 Tax=Actinokineospora globicatena TaxID=103729 RepID=A0A9W6QGS6_9PSEU|nr:DUF6221 family protein [Actinokineospora globicatena]GLW90736.1 hypothetical protein Aglo03_15520 [Actinokineospora globicatena]
MDLDAVRAFLTERLSEDERRAAAGGVPLLEEAERLGRLHVLRSDDGTGLLLAPIASPGEPVPFAEKAPLLRAEIAIADEDTLRLLATAYDAHHGWQEEWRVQQ